LCVQAILTSSYGGTPLKELIVKYKITSERPLSYSAINLFSDPQWGSPEKWYDSYILGKRQTSREMTFGSMIDKRFQNDPTFLPEIQRYSVLQHEMKVMFADIPLIGYSDGWEPDTARLMDLKTGKAPWTKKRANDTTQLTMYALMLYIQDKVKPEDISFTIVHLPTKENGDFSIGFRDDPVVPQYFHTKRIMEDLLLFGAHIKKTYAQMQEYVASRDNVR